MGKNICKILKEKDVGSIGIGAMIVFIAMVLVAGIAASVLIQTSTRLEAQALATGQETTAEVSSGLDVVNIEGFNASGSITHLAIIVRARAGSRDIDLNTTVLEISDSATKNFLTQDPNTFTLQANINGDIFAESYYPTTNTDFGIIVLEDADSSCSAGTSAVINSGDYVILSVNVTSCFGGFSPRDDIWGTVLPEEGSPGVITFQCPPSFTTDVIELQ
jgi:flagellin FlaB